MPADDAHSQCFADTRRQDGVGSDRTHERAQRRPEPDPAGFVGIEDDPVPRPCLGTELADVEDEGDG